MSVADLKKTLEIARKAILENGSIGDQADYEAIASKTLLIAAAGELERDITQVLLKLGERYQIPEFLNEFIRKQALERRYHAMFDWNSSNINRFTSLFGKEKGAAIKAAIADDLIVKHFIFIGSERNKIVHKGLSYASLDNTFNEIWVKYEYASQLPIIIDQVFKNTP